MKKNICHFLYIPWTGLGLHDGYRGDEWLVNRIRVFNTFVLPSIVNQSNQNFYVWMSFRPEEENNPIVQDFVKMLANIRGFRAVVTYNGCCFFDDKYEYEVAMDRLYSNLKESLPILAPVAKDAEMVLMTIWPSDDMYLSNTVKATQDFFMTDRKGYQMISFPTGYIINYATGDVAEYNPDTNPPFFTIRFEPEDFLAPARHMSYTGPYKSHEFVIDKLKCAFYNHRQFVVGTHGENISTTFNIPYRGRMLTTEERDDFMSRARLAGDNPQIIS